MELSINAIVTLVIAMTVLALGLGMLNGVLSFGGSSLASSIDGFSVDVPASSFEPLVIANPLKLNAVGSSVVLASFYNAGNSRCDQPSLLVGAWLYVECPDLPLKRTQTVTSDVSSGSFETLGLVLEFESGVVAGIQVV